MSTQNKTENWAARAAQAKLGGQYVSLSPRLTAELLRQEHRRAVRIVRKKKQWIEGDGYNNMSADFCAGYYQACHDLLAALTRGRGRAQ